MGPIGRVIGTLVGLLVAAAVAGAVAARAAKESIVRRDDPDDDEVALAAIFEPLAFRSTAGAFRGGTVDCWYGGGMIDLREATLAPEGATLKVRAIFGGGQIVVPEAWQVDLGVGGIGGAGDARPKVDRGPDAPRLTIEGVALFGGFGVSSTMPPDADTFMRRTRSAMDARKADAESEPVPVMSV